MLSALRCAGLHAAAEPSAAGFSGARPFPACPRSAAAQRGLPFPPLTAAAASGSNSLENYVSRRRRREEVVKDGGAGVWGLRDRSSERWAAAAAAAEGFSAEAAAEEKETELFTSISELQEKLQRRLEEKLAEMKEGEDEEDDNSDSETEEDGDGRERRKKRSKKKQLSAAVESEGPAVLAQESGVESVVQEYKLTEEGTLSTVKVTVGDTTHPTPSNLDRILAEVRVQATAVYGMVRNFSVRGLVEGWRAKKETGLEDLKFNAAMYAPKAGISNITQWTATELTLQRASMQRIARDTLYLIWAFNLFGVVRILEALATVFSTNPPNFMKIFDAVNALDPLTIASLAGGLRQPVLGMLDVDPTDLEGVCGLRAKFWAELHKFYERQWKVMATLGIARLLALIVSHLPAAEWVTKKFKMMWDISMALPIF